MAAMAAGAMAAAGMVVAGMAAVAMEAVAMEAVIAAAGAAAVGVGAAVGVRIGGLTTITTNRVTAAGCACGYCAVAIGWCGPSGSAGNAQNTRSGFRRDRREAVF